MSKKGQKTGKRPTRGRNGNATSRAIYGNNSPSLQVSNWPRAGPSSGDVEYKNIDTTVSASFSTTGSATLLNGCFQGTTASTRIGRKLMIRRVDLVLQPSPSATTGLEHAAILLVVDRQPNGGTFNSTDLLTFASSLALPNPNEFERFSVVARWDTVFNGNSVGAQGPATQNPIVLEQIPVSVPTFFNAGNAGTIGDIQTNALFLYAIGNQAAGATNPVIAGYCRIWFTDS